MEAHHHDAAAHNPHALDGPLAKLPATSEDIDAGSFHGDTLVSTCGGLRPIRQLAAEGGAVVRTDYGRWTRAVISSVGTGRLVRVDMTRMQARKTIYCTANQRWLTLGSGYGNQAKRELPAQHLSVGEYLAFNFGRGAISAPSELGIIRGIVYGDGHRDSRGSGPRRGGGAPVPPDTKGATRSRSVPRGPVLQGRRRAGGAHPPTHGFGYLRFGLRPHLGQASALQCTAGSGEVWLGEVGLGEVWRGEAGHGQARARHGVGGPRHPCGCRGPRSSQ